ncbi:hypothetical protein [Candidatus Poriferisodalis sp.]|uniref:hypothetical protein n=1 Tax=Candidatus Poriferisodalis sp. TaxID=3101277 RepID=UPI003B027B8F
MANYDANRPRPSIDEAAALPGDLPSADIAPNIPERAEHPEHTEAPEQGADSEADPPPAPASRLLPRRTEPVDRRLLAALGGAVAVGWLIAAAVGWWLWRRWRGCHG